MQQQTYTHPASLKILFATEMWERYGFYVVQTLLALYLSAQYKWDDTSIYYLVGAFTAITYLSPLLGGWIADYLLGQKLSVVIGAFILLLSYLALSLISNPAKLLYALSGIAVGTGLLKPNISSLVGNIYGPQNPNRERGFTIFYMGLVTGIILGTTLPHYFLIFFGWSGSFLSAMVGMIIAISIFSYGINHYQILDYKEKKHSSYELLGAISLILGMWWLFFYVMTNHSLADSLFSIIGLASLAYLIITARKNSASERHAVIVITILCLISTFFWTFYFQIFHFLTLFLNRLVEPTLFGMPFPPPYYIAIQSAGIIFFGLFLSKLKSAETIEEYSIRVSNKFLFSICLTLLAYVFITLVCQFDLSNTLFSPLLIIPAYLLLSLAEVLLSPVGLAAMSILSSRHNVGTMTGIFFVSLGIGGFLSGRLAEWITKNNALDLNNLAIPLLKQYYATTLHSLLGILGIATIICIILNRIIKGLKHSDR